MTGAGRAVLGAATPVISYGVSSAPVGSAGRRVCSADVGFVVSATLTTILPFARARSSAASASIAWFSGTTLATRDTCWPWAHAWASDASVVGSGCTATLVAVGRTQDLLILD